MFLIGQFDSPFVRRVGIALKLYRIDFEHRPWSTFGDGDQLAQYNPLRRVPTLVVDNGETLIESGAMRPAGLREVERAKEVGRWDAAYASQSKIEVPDDLQDDLRGDFWLIAG